MTEVTTIGQYGNVMTSSKELALNRGSGAFNPPPTRDQTTNRGNSYMNAYNKFVEGRPEGFKQQTQLQTPIQELDRDNKTALVVGSSEFHPQTSNSWNSRGYEGSRSEEMDQYTYWAQKSLQLDPNPLMIYFFNKKNIEYLLERMVTEIKRIRNISINKQSIDELLIIMRNNYIYALSGWMKTEGVGDNTVLPRGGNKPCSLITKISNLNKSVLQECIKQILSGIDGYKQYYKDASSLPLPLEHPRQTTMKGSKVLSERVGLQDNSLEYTNSVNSYNQRYNIL